MLVVQIISFLGLFSNAPGAPQRATLAGNLITPRGSPQDKAGTKHLQTRVLPSLPPKQSLPSSEVSNPDLEELFPEDAKKKLLSLGQLLNPSLLGDLLNIDSATPFDDLSPEQAQDVLSRITASLPLSVLSYLSGETEGLSLPKTILPTLGDP
ncbi:MAG: hypothetical protein M1833_001058 [Piccolia ochrophora]|nr:MAG: hypothetical protein M1833_001058 [Piccolia ochrophora]